VFGIGKGIEELACVTSGVGVLLLVVAQYSDRWRCCWQKDMLPTGGDVVDKEGERSKITLKYKQAKSLVTLYAKVIVTVRYRW
jgi:hypothetical protein